MSRVEGGWISRAMAAAAPSLQDSAPHADDEPVSAGKKKKSKKGKKKRGSKKGSKKSK